MEFDLFCRIYFQIMGLLNRMMPALSRKIWHGNG